MGEKRMAEKIVEVTGFKGQSYGYNGPLIFTFHYEGKPVRFIKNISPKYGPYHLDLEDITLVQE